MTNEKRLIDYEQAKRATYEEIFWSESEQAAVRNFLATLPKVDAVEVVHGRWLLEQKFADGTADYKCSACDYDDTFHFLVSAFYKHCPYCGAKMDGERREGE